jgi:uncharacterized protein involved in exopolysaccharide biosynthesis
METMITEAPGDRERAGAGLAPLSLLVVAEAALRYRRMLFGLPVALGLVAVVLGLLLRGHTASASFLPETAGGDLSRYANLAAQFGVSLPVSGRTQESPDFYVELLRSRELLSAVALDTFRIAGEPDGQDTMHGPLVDLLRVEDETPDARVLQAVEKLRGRVSANVELASGVVTLEVTLGHPALAEQVARRLLDRLNAFNLGKRQSRARAERAFIAERLEAAQQELRQAEAELERFLAANRRYQDSPQLVFAAARLQRRVDLRQQVFSMLAQAYEQARIDEVRDTPVLTILDAPEGSSEPSGSVIVLLLAGMMAGFAVALAWVLAGEYVAREREVNPSAVARLVAVWSEITPRLARRIRRPGAATGDR